MRIAQAQIQMSSAHQAVARHEVRQRLSLTAPAAAAAPAPSDVAAAAPVVSASPERVALGNTSSAATPREISALRRAGALTPAAAARATLRANLESALRGGEVRPAPVKAPAPAPSGNAASADGADGQTTCRDDLKTAVVRALFEKLTGHKMAIDPHRLERDLSDGAQRAADATEGVSVKLLAPGREAAGLAGDVQMPGPVAGIEFERVETSYESESVAVSARATVTLEDGRTLEVGVDMAMSRERFEQTRVSMSAAGASGGGAAAPQAKDPLVLSFDAPAPALRAERTAFDLDADGTAEQVHLLAPGSGFVALDRNANGRIDDGSELFGAKTGDGFAELAALDDDGNGFIDEGDKAFDQLKIWSRDAAGRDELRSLKERGVGALYVGKIAAPFNYRGAENESVAQLRSAGFYVGEPGVSGAHAGLLAQLDLVV